MKIVIAVLAMLATSTAAFAQNCDRGCPCGNTCISCADTCRVGNGTASGGGGETDYGLVFAIVAGSVVALGCLVGLAVLMPTLTAPSSTEYVPPTPETSTGHVTTSPADYNYIGGDLHNDVDPLKLPTTYRLTMKERGVLRSCLPRLYETALNGDGGDDARMAVRAKVLASIESAFSKSDWLDARGCNEVYDDRFERCLIDLAPLGATTRAELEANEAALREGYRAAASRSAWLEERGCP